MKEYGEMEKEINDLKKEIQEITNQSTKFSEFQKAKRELEFEESKKKSSTYSQLDSKYLSGSHTPAAGRSSGQL